MALTHVGLPHGYWRAQLDLDRTPLQFMKVCALKEPSSP
jgi:hypothetical protein